MITCLGEWLIQPTRFSYSHQPYATQTTNAFKGLRTLIAPGGNIIPLRPWSKVERSYFMAKVMELARKNWQQGFGSSFVSWWNSQHQVQMEERFRSWSFMVILKSFPARMHFRNHFSHECILSLYLVWSRTNRSAVLNSLFVPRSCLSKRWIKTKMILVSSRNRILTPLGNLSL